MVVCICSNLNEDKIKEVVENHCNCNLSPFDIHDKLNCNVGCGKCIPTIIEIIDQNKREEKTC